MFRFKQFSVEHDRSSMKVGTDGVLLGAWCDVTGARRALDVGTGSGVIALMLAQRAPGLIVDAIDIDHDSVVEAQGNFSHSPWGYRLCAIEGDFSTMELPGKYDIIVSNPPFFTNGVLPPLHQRMNARHTQSLTYGQLLSRAQSLLTNAGKISFISPADVAEVILDTCSSNNLYISKITEVISVKNTPPKRLLWEMTNVECVTSRGVLTIENTPGDFTEEYRELCRDFYLKF